MPVLWLTAFGMSFPQTYWKELQTVSTQEYVVTQGNILLRDWIGEGSFQKFLLSKLVSINFYSSHSLVAYWTISGLIWTHFP